MGADILYAHKYSWALFWDTAVTPNGLIFLDLSIEIHPSTEAMLSPEVIIPHSWSKTRYVLYQM